MEEFPSLLQILSLVQNLPSQTIFPWLDSPTRNITTLGHNQPLSQNTPLTFNTPMLKIFQ